jgi:putative ABC transport system permease protein
MNKMSKIIPVGTRESIFLALRSIWRNKVRSALTMLGIIIGVAAVIILVGLGQGLQKYITGQFEELGTNLVMVLPGDIDFAEGHFGQGPPNFAGSKLTIKQAERIAKLGSPIETAVASIEMPASIKYRAESKYTTIAGISAEYGNVRNIEVKEGRNITQVDVDLARKVVVLGQGIVEDLFGASQALGKDVSIGEKKFKIIGILKEIGSQSIGFDINNFAAIPVTSAQRLFGTDDVQAITVKAEKREDIPQVINMTEKFLSKQLKESEFSVFDQSNLLETINEILGVLTAALGGIAAISLVVGGVGIMNIMLVSVTERTREIGLRKAVGAKPSDIRNQFLIEAVTLTVLGGILGITLGVLVSAGLNRFFPTSVTLWSVTLAFGVSATVGIIFGIIPAIRASRLDPIDALRYE